MKRVYLDHAATTPVRPEVVEVMVEYMTSRFGNPSSLHMEGREAKDALEEARRRVATLINASPEEICFTSGGTEADNMAIKGAVLAAGGRGHIITTKIEHHAVLHCAQALGETGCEVTYLDVDGDGLVDPDDVRRAIRKNTLLVSVMLANNEVGTIQPISEIAAICKEHGVLLHTDAVQVPGQIPVDVPALGADMMSISSHKIYGPKGVGALYIRNGVKLAPIVHGGGQEGARRAGTENVPGIVGFGKAAELASQELNWRRERLLQLRERLIQGVLSRIEGVRLNGHRERRLPNNVNVSPLGVEGKALVLGLDSMGIAASSGSACRSGAVEPSHVLLAMGVSDEAAKSALRMTLGISNTDEDMDYVIDSLAALVRKLRGASPVVPLSG